MCLGLISSNNRYLGFTESAWISQDNLPIPRTIFESPLQSLFCHARWHVHRFLGWGGGQFIVFANIAYVINGQINIWPCKYFTNKSREKCPIEVIKIIADRDLMKMNHDGIGKAKGLLYLLEALWYFNSCASNAATVSRVITGPTHT